MLNALISLASEVAHEEPDKTLFYIAGGVLAAYAVLLSALGLQRADWPNTQSAARGVMALSAVLVAATLVIAVATN
jgi:hypothetical protein